MRKFSGPDRRRPSSQALSVVVDVGIVCLDSLGEGTAKLLYLTHNVPSTVATRVLFHKDARRTTELTRAVEDAITWQISERREQQLDLPLSQ